VRLASTEQDEQILLVDWLNKCTTIPVIKIDNEGKRTPWGGALAKRMGLYPGASDLFLARPSQGFHGLWIEMKSVKGKVSATQKEFMTRMFEEGYAITTCYSGDEAIKFVKKFYAI